MLELDARVSNLDGDPEAREMLILQYKPFILQCASNCAKRYITDNDDEWSIALQAFSQAIDQYNREAGSFLSFAKLVIRRRLYDYFDSTQKYSHEISVSPSLFSGEVEEEEITTVYLQVKKNLIYHTETTLTDEIESANSVFTGYGFSFFDLTSCSPKAGKTKEACAKAIIFLLKNQILINEMRHTRLLPLKILVQKTQLPRKILERHRKYIIAVVELFSGDYPGLTDYLRPIREELNQ